MSWHSIRGHDRVIEKLKTSLQQGRFPHALLFVGPDGIGKKAVARKLAQALLCEVNPPAHLNPCGQCPGCVQVAGFTHPDFIETGTPPDKHELPISVIRELCDQFALKPSRGGYKVALLDDADDLNAESSNAFLKTLEEPPPGSVLILLGTAAELQLETIVSRCQVVRFDPLASSEIATLLIEQGIATDQDDAARLAAMSEGSVSRAIGLADAELERLRRSLIDEVAGEHGFNPPDLTHRLQANIKLAGKESADQRRRASLLIGELAPSFEASCGKRLASPLPFRTTPTAAPRRPWRNASRPRSFSIWPNVRSKPIIMCGAGFTWR